MIVSCSSCTTKFNVPDAKVAGKRARMKCKRCGETIVIDGTKLTFSLPSANTHTPASRPGSSRPFHDPPRNEPSLTGPKDISSRWRIVTPNGKRNEASLADLVQLYRGGAFPAGALICAPGKTAFLTPSNFPELERKAERSVTAPRLPLPTFTDETVALGAAETEVLKLQSRPSASVAPPMPASDSGFFDEGDVRNAMSSFDNLTSVRPGQLPPPNAVSPAPHSSRPIKPPIAPAPYPIPRQGQVPPSSPFNAPRPSPFAPALESTQARSPVFSAPPPSDSHNQAPAFTASPLAQPALVARAPLLQEPQWDADSSASFGRNESLQAARTQRSGIWVLVIISLLIASGAVGIARYRPEWIAQGTTYARHLIELVRPPLAPLAPLSKGPEFDTASAGLVLGQAAQDADKCKDVQGPVGRGRARVLFDPSGNAISVMVSEPFHETPVGDCVVSRFLKAKVPAFGGQPVIVNKTFEIR